MCQGYLLLSSGNLFSENWLIFHLVNVISIFGYSFMLWWWCDCISTLLQSSVCLKQLMFDLLELLLLSAFPELDYVFKQLHEEKSKFGEFKSNWWIHIKFSFRNEKTHACVTLLFPKVKNKLFMLGLAYDFLQKIHYPSFGVVTLDLPLVRILLKLYILRWHEGIKEQKCSSAW